MAINFGFDLATLSFFLGLLVPTAAVVLACLLEGRLQRIKGVKPPQTDKLLRPAGYSLMVEIDRASERCITCLATAALFCSFAGLFMPVVSNVMASSSPDWLRAAAIGLLICATIPGIFFAVATYRALVHARSLKLGLRGEQATAEALHEAADAGYRAFHDVQGEENWNIDHVAVGTKGVFLIETKARCRRGARDGQAEHKVRFDGITLTFPFGSDRETIVQARRNSKWLADYLAKKTGEPVAVDPIVVLPGWWVDDDRSGPVRAMNCNYLTQYLRHQREKLDSSQVTRILTALEEKNRTLEFW